MITSSFGRTSDCRNPTQKELRKGQPSPGNKGLVYQTLDGRILNNEDFGVNPLVKSDKKNF